MNEPSKLQIERWCTQARLSEMDGHFAMAAILWHRVKEDKSSYECERIIQAMAENEKVILRQCKPVVMKFNDVKAAQ